VIIIPNGKKITLFKFSSSITLSLKNVFINIRSSDIANNYDIRQSAITTKLNKLLISRFTKHCYIYRLAALWHNYHAILTSLINLTQITPHKRSSLQNASSVWILYLRWREFTERYELKLFNASHVNFCLQRISVTSRH
jgi:hypothetical protein